MQNVENHLSNGFAYMQKLQHCNVFVFVVVISDVATCTNTRQGTDALILPHVWGTVKMMCCILQSASINTVIFPIATVNYAFALIQVCQGNRLKEQKAGPETEPKTEPEIEPQPELGPMALQVVWLCLWLFGFNDSTLLFGFYSNSFSVLLTLLRRGMRPSNFNSITHYKRKCCKRSHVLKYWLLLLQLELHLISIIMMTCRLCKAVSPRGSRLPATS